MCVAFLTVITVGNKYCNRSHPLHLRDVVGQQIRQGARLLRVLVEECHFLA